MKISQLLEKTAIIADLKSVNKDDVIQELAASVARSTKASGSRIAEVLMEREQLGSTGIGQGIAIPHGKLDLVDTPVIGFGLSVEGVEYDSLDNKPVHIFFVLLTPENSTGGHLKVLAQISKLLKMDSFKKGLIAAKSVDEIFRIIESQDEDF